MENPKDTKTTTQYRFRCKRDGDESRKNLVYGIWLNPKCRNNGQSAAKPRIGEGPTTKIYYQ